MMHRCSSSSHHHQGNMPSPCTCALFHSQNTNSFSSMLFSSSSSIPNHHKCFNDHDHDHQSGTDMMYPSSSSVDCTLSLGTPSTRLSDQYHDYNRLTASNFCSSGWDNILQTKNSTNFSTAQTTTTTTHKSSRSTNNNATANNNNYAYNDTLLARRCANCDTTSTPLWRNGPRGPKSLCNACGIRYKKEERRATAANGSASSGAMEQQQALNYGYNNHQAAQKMQCYTPAAAANEFRFIQDSDVRDSADAIPFLSWRLNVTDRPSLVHDFTR